MRKVVGIGAIVAAVHLLGVARPGLVEGGGGEEPMSSNDFSNHTLNCGGQIRYTICVIITVVMVVMVSMLMMLTMS